MSSPPLPNNLPIIKLIIKLKTLRIIIWSKHSLTVKTKDKVDLLPTFMSLSLSVKLPMPPRITEMTFNFKYL
jgi:hypothetical protein